MTPFCLNPFAGDTFELLVGNAIGNAEDLYLLDGETALRHRNGQIETFDAALLDRPFDAELDFTGGQP